MKTTERISQFRNICKPFNKVFIKLSLMVLCIQCSYLLMAYWTSRIIDGVGHKELSTVMWGVSGIALSLCLSNLFGCLLGFYHIKGLVFDIESHISQVTLERISKFSIGQVINQNSGFKQDTLKKGEAAISELAQTLFLEVIPSAIRVLTAVGLLLFVNFWMGAIATISITLIILRSMAINRKTIPLVRINRRKETKISTAYWEVIKHLRLVISTAQEERAVTEFDDRYKKYSDEGKLIWTTYIYKVALTREPFAIIGLVLIYAYGVSMAWNGEVTIGRFIYMTSLATISFNALNNVGNMERRIVRNFVLVSRYFDLLDITPAVVEVINPVKVIALKKRIEFRNVSFTYPEFIGVKDEDEDDGEKNSKEKEKLGALKNVSVTIERGEIVALVGPSGSGKSSFINLLQRGYDPDEGQILVDGHNLRELELKGWRETIGIVDQDPKLWDETLRYNIVYGLNGSGKSITDEELDDLAKKTRIDEFYHRLGEKKFETVIGENGIQLSGGQRQRAAIARALIKNPSLLILDEATNALDPKNESIVHEAIRKALEGRTGIIIAHRLSTIRHADKIVVFEKGSVVGVGNDASLMETCESYRGLVEYERRALGV